MVIHLKNTQVAATAMMASVRLKRLFNFNKKNNYFNNKIMKIYKNNKFKDKY